MIEAEYEITDADYKAAQWLYLRKRPWKMALYWTSDLGWAVIAACISGWFFATLKVPRVGIRLWIDCGAVFFGAFSVKQLFRAMRQRRSYENCFSDVSTRTVRLTANDCELSFAVPGKSESRLYWNAIDEVAENSEVLLLFVGKEQFLIMPHRALDEAQWAGLRELIAAKSRAAS